MSNGYSAWRIEYDKIASILVPVTSDAEQSLKAVLPYMLPWLGGHQDDFDVFVQLHSRNA
ncbi:hypothetical protein [Nocardia cyriacigeorgica]|uniref:hypothetical protein n=1 Tax=Nocardia cyriacigeorgica TaxID=135487 RepID=UPI001894152B|nr:hypothetical protein [Nocardia cyriacigeorgica]MBF6412885.1 hypothetical protein [Nocardia cyriacigeorgica]